ncbi:VQ motif-containing protein 25-like [Chenopodium quinoa]|uniref:VQ motif-containing protein 25-like n=1 Tax=Chenopodium quinoa TaxID=63459 RepID=UPI000B78B32F|nr:VQ motif-containing protein 25-like [Chenopodium quinoa]
MTHMFKKQNSSSMLTQTTTAGALAMHRDSRVITKVQPKIRIIHIFAPEIIKTDVANFRELVQRLTGKPDAGGSKGKGKGKEKGKKVKALEAAEAGPGCNNNKGSNNISTKLEVMVGSGSSSSPSSSSDQQNHSNNNNQEAWRLNGGDHIINSSGGYLTGFSDLDYSFDFNNLFHLGAADGSSHLNSIAENTPLSYRG